MLGSHHNNVLLHHISLTGIKMKEGNAGNIADGQCHVLSYGYMWSRIAVRIK
jgi:hypothetical protein